jgi:hypothetical protein
VIDCLLGRAAAAIAAIGSSKSVAGSGMGRIVPGEPIAGSRASLTMIVALAPDALFTVLYAPSSTSHDTPLGGLL